MTLNTYSCLATIRLSLRDKAILPSKGHPMRVTRIFQVLSPLMVRKGPLQFRPKIGRRSTVQMLRMCGAHRLARISLFFKSSTPGFTCNFSKLYRLLQNFDELGDCRVYLGLFFPNREQFELTLKFS